MRTRYAKDGVTIGVGEIDNLPGSSQIAVFHSAFIRPDFRKGGHGFKAHVERLEKAIALGYDFAICTVDVTNAAQVKILEDNGWKLLQDFYSTKTTHRVLIYGLKLTKE